MSKQATINAPRSDKMTVVIWFRTSPKVTDFFTPSSPLTSSMTISEICCIHRRYESVFSVGTIAKAIGIQFPFPSTPDILSNCPSYPDSGLQNAASNENTIFLPRTHLFAWGAKIQYILSKVMSSSRVSTPAILPSLSLQNSSHSEGR